MSKKKNLEIIVKILPDFFKNAIDYLKVNFQENGKKILENAGGTAGILIGLFAQPLLDKYFKNIEEKKLENFGFNVYLKASLLQANHSLNEIDDQFDESLTSETLFDIFNKSIDDEISQFKKNEVILIYQSKFHPAVVFVKNECQRLLRDLAVKPVEIKKFLKHFNENIEALVVKEFGDAYEDHLKSTELFRLRENETKLLWDTIQQGKIGFRETEDLKYETAFGRWKKVNEVRYQGGDELTEANVFIEDIDDLLKPVEELIEEYFDGYRDNSLESILFIIADFGKGKSVFMRRYAAELAKQYLDTSDGYFPVYFNLRDFKNYSSEPRLGVISDYLEVKYGIKINDEYFQKKRYLFLVDSLDESGELTKTAIDAVVSSIKNIQGINKSTYRVNRIIITSRPFDEGLSYHLNEHKPHIIKNKDNRDVSYFIDVNGFTKDQFNDWLLDSLKNFSELADIKATGFARELINSVLSNDHIDIHQELLGSGTLSYGELKRPIFAYMVYQLIINNVDFLAVGKLGVYFSFLNLLTKEAKHIHDVNYKVNLKEEFEFRNVLQATASLWMYERQNGKQGMLTKADICRVLEGKSNNETDSEILERFKGQGFTEIQFLSHSYFGESDNVLHFQHQSFAEILLAEYYLKVFIKYALDEDADFEEARTKLVLGEPTEQTVLFLTEMLRLLRETASPILTKEIIEKRKLLFPLMASLATNKYNRLFCNDIFYSWYIQCNIDVNQTEFPTPSLENWCISTEKLDKIILLSSKIINSKITYLSTDASPKTALFDGEILEFKKPDIGRLTPNIDRWLALLAGTTLYNDLTNIQNPSLFNWDYRINYKILFEMLKSWNYAFNISAPKWGESLFMGINMEANTELNLSHFNLDAIDFSYSLFKDMRCWCTNWSRSKLNYCSFENARFITSTFFSTSIQNIKSISGNFYFRNCECGNGIRILDSFLPIEGNEYFPGMEDLSISRHRQLVTEESDEGVDMFITCSGFMIYGLQRSYFKIKDIEDWFIFEDIDLKRNFLRLIKTLKKYES